MAKIAKSSTGDKKKSSSHADPSVAASSHKRLDMKKVAQRAVENLKWARDHPEAVMAWEREKFLDELSIEPYQSSEKEDDDPSE